MEMSGSSDDGAKAMEKTTRSKHFDNNMYHEDGNTPHIPVPSSEMRYGEFHRDRADTAMHRWPSIDPRTTSYQSNVQQKYLNTSNFNKMERTCTSFTEKKSVCTSSMERRACPVPMDRNINPTPMDEKSHSPLEERKIRATSCEKKIFPATKESYWEAKGYYSVGEKGKEDDMLIHASLEDKLFSIARLREADGAFVRRSGGRWTYAVVKTRPHGPKATIELYVETDGATKMIPVDQWAKYIRLIKPRASHTLPKKQIVATPQPPLRPSLKSSQMPRKKLNRRVVWNLSNDEYFDSGDISGGPPIAISELDEPITP